MQKITFSGLNTRTGTSETFSFNFGDQNFDRILTLFDSVLLFDKEIFCLNSAVNTFERVIVEGDVDSSSSVSVNTDSVWVLSRNGKELSQLISPFSRVSQTLPIDAGSGSVVICATDVNVYLMDTQSATCVYQLQSEEKSTRINECSVLAIPLNKSFFGERIRKVACGKEHVLLLTEPSGQVYSFGIGTKGQLGHGTIDNCYEPKLIENFRNVKDIACGGWHSALIDENGNVYMWGWNSNGQLGIQDEDEAADELETIVCIPVLIYLFGDDGQSVKFKNVSLGSRHSLLLDVNNNAYSCGWNKYKQLILDTIGDDVDAIKRPMLIQKYKNSVLDVKAGPWYSLILTN